MRYRNALNVALAMLLVTAAAVPLPAQRRPVPRPFPTPEAPPARPAAAPVADAPAPASVTDAGVPTEATLGVPLYPPARYITSYDAGRGQRFHLFGTSARFDDIVRYYSTRLRDRGRRVYDAPPIHQFETARFRDNRMDFRPSVTIKDYTWGGSAGYIDPASGGEPAIFPTIIQITTLPEGTANRQR
ncbi:MAG: hypothetical protein J4G16_00915 [Acidobacteria bacterium]|nr:hypothetical protein [Acidobacteriota bacterium]